MSQPSRINRRNMLKHTAALTAVFAAWRVSPALAENVMLNILNSNTLWAESADRQHRRHLPRRTDQRQIQPL